MKTGSRPCARVPARPVPKWRSNRVPANPSPVKMSMVEAPNRQDITSEQLAQLAAEACDDRKAVDIRLIRVDEV